MRIIEGTVAEIVEYQQLTGQLPAAPPALGAVVEDEGFETGEQETVAAEWAEVERHVEGRARNPLQRQRIMEYLKQVRSLGTIVEAGKSQKTRDGLSNYLMVRDDGPRRFGAVAYIRPANGGLTLRLGPDDVADQTGDVVRVRNVRAGNAYRVICPLSSDEAVDVAAALTERALESVRK